MTDLKMRVENETAMAALAAKIGVLLRPGDVVTLEGGLGAGKTAFARALINSLSAAPEEVPSPTFTLVQAYDLPKLSPPISLWHFDLYRLPEKEIDILELGWEDARRGGVCLVEWPGRLGGLLPRDRLEIKIDFVKDSENYRDVTLIPMGTWTGRIEGMP